MTFTSEGLLKFPTVLVIKASMKEKFQYNWTILPLKNIFFLSKEKFI